MPTTPHLGLPLIAAAQAQKHVTHNEALAGLDALVHLCVKERDRLAPPAAPAEGDRYLVGAGAGGAFAGQDGRIALFDAGGWRFFTPAIGYIAYAEADAAVFIFDGSLWKSVLSLAEVTQFAKLGINTAPDAVNRLAVMSNAVLLTAIGIGAGGSGDHRLVLNKEALGNTVSQLYQRAFSGRAESGLVGDDDFRIKVSPDGATWRDAMRIDRSTGEVHLPYTYAGLRNYLINSEFSINQRVFAGGNLLAGVYGFDRWKAAASGGCNVTKNAAGVATLTGFLVQVIENPGLAGQVVTVSVEDPTATLAVDLSGASGTIAAGSGRRGVTLTVPSGATGNVTLTLSGTAVSFAKPMLTRGTVAPLFERLPQTLLIQLCQRYYEKSYDLGTAPGAASVTGLKVSRATVTSSNAAVDGLATSFAVRKRATASTTWYSPTGVAARVRDQVTSTDLVVTATTIPSEWGTGAPNVTGPTAGNLVYAHWVAEAEL